MEHRHVNLASEPPTIHYDDDTIEHVDRPTARRLAGQLMRRQPDTTTQPTSDCGTLAGYKNGCKCPSCRRANADYVAARRRATAGQPVKRRTPRTHGTNACYQTGCRRPECREAHRVYSAKWRHRDTNLPTWIDRNDWVAVERWLEQQRVARIVEPRTTPKATSPWARTQADADNMRPGVAMRETNPIFTLTRGEYHRARGTATDVTIVQPHQQRVAA